MDIFSRNRTFLVVFAILVIFVIFIMQSFKSQAKELFSNLVDNYPQPNYDNGEPINIRKNTKTFNPRGRYRSDALFSNNRMSRQRCETQCKKQPECNPIENNECSITYNDSDKSCYCQFRKKDITTEGFEDRITPLDFAKNTLVQLPNLAPVAQYNTSKDQCEPLKKVTLGKWSDFNIRSRNEMSYSFWIYFNESELSTKTRRYTEILRLYDQGTKYGDGRDRYTLIHIYESSPVLQIRSCTVNNVNDTVSLEDELKNHRIGFPNTPTWVCITFGDGVMKVYFNNELKTHHQTDTFYEPQPDSIFVLGKSNDNEGIYLSQFRLYDKTLSDDDVKVLYNSSTPPPCNALTSTSEGFTGSFKQLFSMFNGSQEGFQSSYSNSIPSEDKCPQTVYGRYLNSHSLFSVEQMNLARESYFNKIQSKKGLRITLPAPLINESVLRKVQNGTTQCMRHGDNVPTGSIYDSNAVNSSNQGKHKSDQNGQPYNYLTKEDKAYLIRNGKTEDFTTTLNEVIKSNKPQNLLSLDDNDEIVIHVKHGAYLHFILNKSSFKGSKYNNDKPRMLNDMRNFIRIVNTDSAAMKCASTQVCSGLTYLKTLGTCASLSSDVYDKTEKYNTGFGHREIKCTHLSKMEYLEIPNRYNFNNHDSTISMWFKVDSSVRNTIDPTYKKNWWLRLLNFGIPKNWYMEKEVIIAIGGEPRHQYLEFYIDGYHVRQVSQVGTGQWQHIIWVIRDGSWDFYHNGAKMPTITEPRHGKKPSRLPNYSGNHEYKQQIGAPGVFWDPVFESHIGDFKIYNKALSDLEAWVEFTGNSEI
jgi:hypothetical protein